MTDLMAARMQMAISLGFHIIFACVGVAMPFLMAAAHALYIRTRKQVYLDLTKTWMRGVAIMFATGAVSGTALSFELGLLWPGFMLHAGAIIGMPFSLEGTAFFLEAIALGIFLYGWGRIPEKTHWFCGLFVGITGLASSFFIVAANGWMNAPTGFDWVNGQAENIDPWAAMFNSAALDEGIHMAVAAFQATGFAVAGLHALLLLFYPGHAIHRAAFRIALLMGGIASLVMPLSGHLSAENVARRQPLKLAAMEAHFHTQKGAPLIIGGIPDVETQEVHYAIEVPKMLSFLAFEDFDAEVKGLDAFPRDLHPPVMVTHFAFQIMVACGSIMALVSLIGLWKYWRRPDAFETPFLLKCVVLCTPLGFIAVEAGWIVTEVGRQPWIIYGVMKTKDALSPMPGLVYPFIGFTLLYAMLTVTTVWLMQRQIRALHAK